MATQDNCVSIHPYFTVSEENLNQAREYCERFVALTKSESQCLYYGFSISGNEIHCREGYIGGEGLLAHLENIGALLGEFLEKLATVTRLEIHGPAAEIEKVKEALIPFGPQYFVLEYGIRN
jgi:hypothetical protein|tara:strand:+ start:290 stop:655 length:366 start_codon:yes stop_codon:yes gene_type:complete